MADIIPEKAITILQALKNEYMHPEVKDACDLAIESIKAQKKISKAVKALLNLIKKKEAKS